jgi:hypothetical protein
MDIEIINGIAKCKFAVFPAIKRRAWVFVGDVIAAPIIKGFNEMHGAKLQGFS